MSVNMSAYREGKHLQKEYSAYLIPALLKIPPFFSSLSVISRSRSRYERLLEDLRKHNLR